MHASCGSNESLYVTSHYFMSQGKHGGKVCIGMQASNIQTKHAIGSHGIVNPVRPEMQSKVACRKLLPCKSKPACQRPMLGRRMQPKPVSKEAKRPIEGAETKNTCISPNFVKIIFLSVFSLFDSFLLILVLENPNALVQA